MAGRLHCLILRGARGLVARCWTPDARLNGQRFTDARLVAGDRLTLGPIELEVLAPEIEPERGQAIEPPDQAEQMLEDLEQQRLEMRAQLEARAAQLERDQLAWNAERAKEESLLAEQRSELDRLQAEAHHEQERRAAAAIDDGVRRSREHQLERQTRELQIAQSELAHREAGIRQAEANWELLEQELTERRADLEAQHAARPPPA